MKGYTKSYEIVIKNDKDILEQLQNTRLAISRFLEKNKYQTHTSYSYGYKVVCCYDDKYAKPGKIYRGEEPVKKFMKEMLKEVHTIL